MSNWRQMLFQLREAIKFGDDRQHGRDDWSWKFAAVPDASEILARSRYSRAVAIRLRK